jgi:hypothetical protein
MDWKLLSDSYLKVLRSDFFFVYSGIQFLLVFIGSLTDKDFYLNPALHVLTSVFVLFIFVIGVASIGAIFEFESQKSQRKRQDYIDECERNLQLQIKQLKEDIENSVIMLKNEIIVDYYDGFETNQEVINEPSPWMIGDWQQHLK